MLPRKHARCAQRGLRVRAYKRRMLVQTLQEIDFPFTIFHLFIRNFVVKLSMISAMTNEKWKMVNGKSD